MQDTYDLVRRVCDMMAGSIGSDCFLRPKSVRCVPCSCCCNRRDDWQQWQQLFPATRKCQARAAPLLCTCCNVMLGSIGSDCSLRPKTVRCAPHRCCDNMLCCSDCFLRPGTVRLEPLLPWEHGYYTHSVCFSSRVKREGCHGRALHTKQASRAHICP